MIALPLYTPRLAVDRVATAAGERALLARLGEWPSVLVAFSGGVDSTYLAWAAARACGGAALAVTGLSESLPAASRAEVARLARRIGIAHLTIETAETRDPRYLANAPDRCYWCKTELYQRLLGLAGERGIAVVADGTNRDDLADLRPGRRAAAERGVVSPLAESGLGKDGVRWLSRRAGLETWDRPASPCLSSRVPHGQPIDAVKLRTVDRAEAAVRALGFREIRVRHLGERARVEIAGEELGRALEGEMAERIEAAVRASGFVHAALDRQPFRSGRLSREAAAAGDGQPGGASG